MNSKEMLNTASGWTVTPTDMRCVRENCDGILRILNKGSAYFIGCSSLKKECSGLVMIAKYDQDCAACCQSIRQGQLISRSTQNIAFGCYVHVKCRNKIITSLPLCAVCKKQLTPKDTVVKFDMNGCSGMKHSHCFTRSPEGSQLVPIGDIVIEITEEDERSVPKSLTPMRLTDYLSDNCHGCTTTDVEPNDLPLPSTKSKRTSVISAGALGSEGDNKRKRPSTAATEA